MSSPCLLLLLSLLLKHHQTNRKDRTTKIKIAAQRPPGTLARLSEAVVAVVAAVVAAMVTVVMMVAVIVISIADILMRGNSENLRGENIWGPEGKSIYPSRVVSAESVRTHLVEPAIHPQPVNHGPYKSLSTSPRPLLSAFS